MWTCSNCGRIFGKAKQPHTCQKIPLKQHFKNKDQAKRLFDLLDNQINVKIGRIQTISIPCCVHLFGTYDFLAALPKKDKLEIRFALDRTIDSPRLKQSVPISSTSFKNCIDINQEKEIDEELFKWLSEAYHLKGGKQLPTSLTPKAGKHQAEPRFLVSLLDNLPIIYVKCRSYGGTETTIDRT